MLGVRADGGAGGLSGSPAWRLRGSAALTCRPPPPPREGHTSIVKELKETLGAKPGAIALSVGGGGLLCGVVQGLHEVGWGDVPIIAMETKGAHSFHEATSAGKLVSLAQVTR